MEILKNALVESAERVIPKKRVTIKNKWITPEILDLMAKRRKLKYTQNDKYKSVDNEIKAKCIEMKGCRVSEQCAELEDLERKDIQMMYSKIKNMSKKTSRPANTTQKDKNNNSVFEKEIS